MLIPTYCRSHELPFTLAAGPSRGKADYPADDGGGDLSSDCDPLPPGKQSRCFGSGQGWVETKGTNETLILLLGVRRFTTPAVRQPM